MGTVIKMPVRDTSVDAHGQLAARLGALTDNGKLYGSAIEFAGTLSDLAADLEAGRVGRDELLIFRAVAWEMTVAIEVMIRAAAMLS